MFSSDIRSPRFMAAPWLAYKHYSVFDKVRPGLPSTWLTVRGCELHQNALNLSALFSFSDSAFDVSPYHLTTDKYDDALIPDLFFGDDGLSRPYSHRHTQESSHTLRPLLPRRCCHRQYRRKGPISKLDTLTFRKSDARLLSSIKYFLNWREENHESRESQMAQRDHDRRAMNLYFCAYLK